MVTDATIQRARVMVRRFLSQTCVISRETAARDEMGYPMHSTEVVASDVACRVISLGRVNSSQAGDVGSQETLTQRYRLILPHGTSIGADYTVTVDGVDYVIDGVVDDWSQAVDVQATMTRATNG